MPIDIWFGCPICAMKVRADRLPETPIPVQVFRQEYGGRDESVYQEIAGQAVLCPQGHTVWEEISDEDPKKIAQDSFIELAIRFLE